MLNLDIARLARKVNELEERVAAQGTQLELTLAALIKVNEALNAQDEVNTEIARQLEALR